MSAHLLAPGLRSVPQSRSSDVHHIEVPAEHVFFRAVKHILLSELICAKVLAPVVRLRQHLL